MCRGRGGIVFGPARLWQFLLKTCGLSIATDIFMLKARQKRKTYKTRWCLKTNDKCYHDFALSEIALQRQRIGDKNNKMERAESKRAPLNGESPLNISASTAPWKFKVWVNPSELDWSFCGRKGRASYAQRINSCPRRWALGLELTWSGVSKLISRQEHQELYCMIWYLFSEAGAFIQLPMPPIQG